MIVLLLAASLVFSNPLSAFNGQFECYQAPGSDWTPIEDDFGNVVYGVPDSASLKGMADQTIVVLNEYGRLQAVALFLDQNEEEKKYRHSRRVWRYLNRKYGSPPVVDPVWVWQFSDGSVITMGSTGKEIAVAFVCPIPNPAAIFEPR